MMTVNNIRWQMAVLGLGGAVLAGCLADQGGDYGAALGRTSYALSWTTDSIGRVVGWAPSLAGRDLNGVGLNGHVLDGRFVLSVSLHDVQLGGGTLRETTLERTTFRGVNARGRAVGSRDFVGATFSATLDDGSSLALTIRDMRRGSSRATRDINYFVVTYATRDSGTAPLCGLDESGDPNPAIPLDGRWDLRTGVDGGGAHVDDAAAFTFACRHYVLAKCVEAGYEPWQRALLCHGTGRCEWTTLADYHQACTRALRADYCGDGTSFTVDGTLLDLYDGLGIRIDSEDWLPEAEWNAAGASCVARERISRLVPPCLADRLADHCGDVEDLDDGTLLVTEVEP